MSNLGSNPFLQADMAARRNSGAGAAAPPAADPMAALNPFVKPAAAAPTPAAAPQSMAAMQQQQAVAAQQAAAQQAAAVRRAILSRNSPAPLTRPAASLYPRTHLSALPRQTHRPRLRDPL